MNSVCLTGHLTADPQLKTAPNGAAVTRVTVAVNRPPNANGEKIADFINVVVWRKQAENLAKYCKKGSHIGIEGRIQSHSYDAQDGSKRYVTEVAASHVTFLPSSKQQTTTQSSTQSVQAVVQPTQVQVQVEENPFEDFANEVVIDESDLPF